MLGPGIEKDTFSQPYLLVFGASATHVTSKIWRTHCATSRAKLQGNFVAVLLVIAIDPLQPQPNKRKVAPFSVCDLVWFGLCLKL